MSKDKIKKDTCEILGFTQEELQERLLERLTTQVMTGLFFDEEEGEEYRAASPFAVKLNQLVTKRIDESVQAIAEKYVLPRVTEFIENLTLQETNKWGEKAGKSLTFTEYLVARAESYMTEMVNFNGKTKAEESSYSWKGTQTRITHLIHQHLHYSIESAMKEALANANSVIVKGIEEAAKTKLKEVAANLKVGVKI